MQPVVAGHNTPVHVTVLGATGSIGKSTIDLIEGHREKFKVRALVGGKNTALLADQAKRVHAECAVIADSTLYSDLKERLAGTGIAVAAGKQAVLDAASLPVDWTMAAIVGAAGLEPTLQAIRQGKTVALANKESLVCAGAFMMDAVRAHGTTLLPVDSEHNAVFQVLDPARRSLLKRIILTASGGPFLRKTRDELSGITPEQAIRHPTWSMGAKISVDSATMMNKSLEIIEAAYFFNLKSEDIDVLIHPQSIIHSMVEYHDGSILAQLGAPDMRTPIAYTLGWPTGVKTTGSFLDLNSKINLDFEPIDLKRFPAVSQARNALKSAGGYPAVMSAANEIAVDAFLSGGLQFSAIENVVDQVLQIVKIGTISNLGDVFDIDALARDTARHVIARLTGE